MAVSSVQVLFLSMLRLSRLSQLHQLFIESLILLLPNCCSQLCAEADWDLFHSLLCTGVRSKSLNKEALLKFFQHANGKALYFLQLRNVINILYAKLVNLFLILSLLFLQKPMTFFSLLLRYVLLVDNLFTSISLQPSLSISSKT